jgi:hypothetical protein
LAESNGDPGVNERYICRFADAQKNLRKSERRVKELTYQQDEDRKNHERMQVQFASSGENLNY